MPKLEPLPYALSTQNEEHGKIQVGDGMVTIVANKGTDLFTDTKGKTHADNTPRALFVPEGDFIFSAKVTSRFVGAYDGGALIVYVDGQHWAKLLFEKFKWGDNGVATTVAAGTGDDAYHGTRSSDHQYLKIVRHGRSYVFYTSADGKAWHFARHFSLPGEAKASIGFSAQSPLSDSLKVEFSDIRYRTGTITDFWQGE